MLGIFYGQEDENYFLTQIHYWEKDALTFETFVFLNVIYFLFQSVTTTTKLPNIAILIIYQS